MGLHEEILEARKDLNHNSVKRTVAGLVRYYNEDIMNYENTWTIQDESQLIESLMIGISVSYIYSSAPSFGKAKLIDGHQRLKTIQRFLNDEFEIEGVTSLPTLNGFRFSNLSPKMQFDFEESQIQVIEFSQEFNDEQISLIKGSLARAWSSAMLNRGRN